MVCDLTGVGLLAASGLAVLVQAIDQFRRHPVALWLVADTRPVLRSLELTGIYRVVPVERHLIDAVTLPHR